MKRSVSTGRIPERRNGKILVIHDGHAIVNSTRVKVVHDLGRGHFYRGLGVRVLRRWFGTARVGFLWKRGEHLVVLPLGHDRRAEPQTRVLVRNDPGPGATEVSGRGRTRLPAHFVGAWERSDLVVGGIPRTDAGRAVIGVDHLGAKAQAVVGLAEAGVKSPPQELV